MPALSRELTHIFSPRTPLDIAAVVQARIARGELVMAPARTFILLRRALLALHVAAGALAGIATIGVAQALASSEMWAYVSLVFDRVYRELALPALLESLPAGALMLWGMALAGWAATWMVRRWVSVPA